jgi:hypothetical protein
MEGIENTMTLFIAHRGNVSGRSSSDENTIDYLEHALSLGYGVECDVQFYNGALWFGHDRPETHCNEQFLHKSNVFVHAKTPETLMVLLKMGGIHCFYHEEDSVTLTSKGYIWCYPGVHPACDRSIWLDLYKKPLPEGKIPPVYGVCGDDSKIMDRFER